MNDTTSGYYSATVRGDRWAIRPCQPCQETKRLLNSFCSSSAVVREGAVFCRSQQALRTILSNKSAQEILGSFALTIVGQKEN